jgi:hypothetical protein
VLPAVVLANVAATLLNPTGAKAFELPFLITGQKLYMQYIGEWQPLRWQYFTGYGIRYVWGFGVLSALAVAGFVRRNRRVDPVDVALGVLFFAAAVRGIRLSAEFAIVVAPIVFRNLAGALPRLPGGAVRVVQACTATLVVLVVPALAVLGPTYAFGLGVKEGKFPEKALTFVEENGLRGPMFNSFPFGDYLCWRAAPERKVFIHGRNDVFPESFFEEYLSAHRSAEEWTAVTERYGITYAILQYAVTESGGGRRMNHLVERTDWVPVYWDRTAVVYVKDVPENSGVIAQWGYRHLKPAYFSFRYLADEVRKNGYEPVLAEIERPPEPGQRAVPGAGSCSPAAQYRPGDERRAAIATNPGRAMPARRWNAHASVGRTAAGKGGAALTRTMRPPRGPG